MATSFTKLVFVSIKPNRVTKKNGIHPTIDTFTLLFNLAVADLAGAPRCVPLTAQNSPTGNPGSAPAIVENRVSETNSHKNAFQ